MSLLAYKAEDSLETPVHRLSHCVAMKRARGERNDKTQGGTLKSAKKSKKLMQKRKVESKHKETIRKARRGIIHMIDKRHHKTLKLRLEEFENSIKKMHEEQFGNNLGMNNVTPENNNF